MEFQKFKTQLASPARSIALTVNC
jgi:predicted transposase YbfD/YdcC